MLLPRSRNKLLSSLTERKITRSSHGGDPYAATNQSGALWVQKKGNSMTLMGAEGFLQACSDLASQTVLAYGGDLGALPEWPEPHRSGLSAEPRPTLPLLP